MHEINRSRLREETGFVQLFAVENTGERAIIQERDKLTLVSRLHAWDGVREAGVSDVQWVKANSMGGIDFLSRFAQMYGGSLRVDEDVAKLYKLKKLQALIVEDVTKGMTNAEIAVKLNIPHHIVSNNIRAIAKVLNIRSKYAHSRYELRINIMGSAVSNGIVKFFPDDRCKEGIKS